MSDPLVIIGTGMAGYQLAQQWRQLDQTTPLVMLTDGAGHSYSKPLLSTALAQGKSPQALVMAEAKTMADKLGAEILTHTMVEAISPAQRTLRWGGRDHAFRDLVLATGAHPKTAPFPVDDRAPVWQVNQWEDYQAWRVALGDQPRRVAVIGAGLVGCEFAHDLAMAGHEVHVFFDTAAPLPRLMPPSMGQHYAKALCAALNLHWHPSVQVQAIQAADVSDGLTLQLANGESHVFDLGVLALGLSPNVNLAKQAGLACDQGVKVDRHGRTSASGIYALGDCAQVGDLCLQYVAPLRHQAMALAKTLAGEQTAIDYPVMPVTVKTATCPVVTTSVCPADAARGHWQPAEPDSVTAAAFYVDDQIKSFVLLGEACRDRLAWTQRVEPLALP